MKVLSIISLLLALSLSSTSAQFCESNIPAANRNFCAGFVEFAERCTQTTASGPDAPRNFCAGDLIFEETFETLDTLRWRHEQTMGGGGNWEFQWYVNDRRNTYIEDGVLHIKPTLTSEAFSEDFVLRGTVVIPASECTDSRWWGCERAGNGGSNIINPIRSGRISSQPSFQFRYGTIEVRAKMPAGDWLWPAIWMMPARDTYGGWPRSGEIDIAEGRGNRRLFSGDTNVGVEQTGFTMHFGPAWNVNGWPTTHISHNQEPGFDEDFHVYKIVWTNENITYFVDDTLHQTIEAGDGFWARGDFPGDNIWADRPLMAPFDQEFYLILNLAVGGVNFFSDDFVNQPDPKPWRNTSPQAARDFWDARNNWLPTWNNGTDDSHLQVDYVRVWAI